MPTLYQRRAWVLVLLVAGLSAAGCNSSSGPPVATDLEMPSSPVLFTDISEQVKLNSVHQPGSTAEFPMPQIMGSGGGFIDANSDGRLDIVLISGMSAGSSPPVLCELWLQLESGEFVNRSEQAQLKIHGYGMGLAVGDVDNDRDEDVFVTTEGDDHLFLNDGQARFTDVTVAAGIKDPRWSSATAFVDYDSDGWLDLLIVNYLDYFPGSVCQDATGRRDYCGPATFQGTVDRLYRNLGVSGETVQFEDVTVSAGLSTGPGKGLGAVCTDLTGDGRTDIYVSNDQEANRLWVQQSDGTFQDEAILRGCAVDLNGLPQASMGTSVGDMDEDGDQDLLLTHLRGETNTFYRNCGSYFEDQTAVTGLGQNSLNYTGFGVGIFDLDHDGDLDCAIANGRVIRSPLHQSTPAETHWKEYAETNQIFLNNGTGSFQLWKHPEEVFCQSVAVSRALACGDVDRDGDLDLLVTQIAGPPRLFRNDAGRGHWLQIRARILGDVRDAIGARILLRVGDSLLTSDLLTSQSYLSAHASQVHFGLGVADHYDSVQVIWPSGTPRRESFPGGLANQHLTILQGTGVPLQSEGTP